MRRSGFFRIFPDAGVGLLHHLFTEIHTNPIVLKDVVVEHVLGGFTQVDNPFSNRGWLHSKRHVLRVGGAGGMVVSTDAADAAGNKVSIPRILSLHENAVTAKDRGGTVTFSNLSFAEVDLGKDAEAAHDPGNRIPIHLYQLAFLNGFLLVLRGNRAHLSGSLSV